MRTGRCPNGPIGPRPFRPPARSTCARAFPSGRSKLIFETDAGLVPSMTMERLTIRFMGLILDTKWRAKILRPRPRSTAILQNEPNQSDSGRAQGIKARAAKRCWICGAGAHVAGGAG